MMNELAMYFIVGVTDYFKLVFKSNKFRTITGLYS